MSITLTNTGVAHLTRRCLRRGLILAGTLGLASITSAQTASAQTNSSWQQVLEAYPRSQTLISETRQVVDYVVALGKVTKRDQQWLPEKQLPVAGDLLRRAVQVPEGHSAETAFYHYHRGLLALGARVLFQCDGRNCGPSNAWANEVFEIKQLYGQDADQYFATYEIVDADQHLHYVMLYSVLRGNKRVFTHLEWLQTQRTEQQAAAPDPGVIQQQLQNRGYYVVSGVSLEDGELSFQAAHLQAVADAVRYQRRRRFHVVGHDYSRAPLSEQLHQSLNYAKQMTAALVAAGVEKTQLEAQGVGSLAPRVRVLDSEAGARRQRAAFRLELVIAE